MGGKAEHRELLELRADKAERGPVEALQAFQDTVTKQLEYLAITCFGLSKVALVDAKAAESGKVRQQQKAQVLMQAESLWHWIVHNKVPASLEGGGQGGGAPPPGGAGAGGDETAAGGDGQQPSGGGGGRSTGLGKLGGGMKGRLSVMANKARQRTQDKLGED